MSTVELNRTGWEEATQSTALQHLRDSVAETQGEVLDHPIYRELNSLEDLIAFTEFHVFAVWDFMLLLKWLQRRFTGVELPWVPPTSKVACRLMNEIVLAEESDAFGLDYSSHFELYVEAMEDLGADTGPIRRFIQLLREGVPVSVALDRAGVPLAAATFVRTTWDIVETCQPHEIAAAFALTRENLVPQMFERVIAAEAVGRERMERFVIYLERHIQLDADEHTPMAFELLGELCGEDPRRWEECSTVAQRCFRARFDLWSGVVAELSERSRRQASVSDVLARLELRDLVAPGEAEVRVKGERLELWSSPFTDGGARCRFELSLPAGVGPRDITAAVRDGVLEIRVPRHGCNGETRVAVVEA